MRKNGGEMQKYRNVDVLLEGYWKPEEKEPGALPREEAAGREG